MKTYDYEEKYRAFVKGRLKMKTYEIYVCDSWQVTIEAHNEKDALNKLKKLNGGYSQADFCNGYEVELIKEV